MSGVCPIIVLSQKKVKNLDIYEKYTMAEIEQSLDDLLDEIYKPWQFGTNGFFYPSQILKNCDPVLYRIAVSEHADFMQQDEDEDNE